MDIKDYKLPKIYKRNGKDCYLDPIRKKLIYITPEETLRQRVVSYLISELKVPERVISVEEHLSHYGVNTKKRADIIIHDQNNEIPVAVIECKSANVYLDEKTEKQALEYCDLIEADYAMIINPFNQRSFKYDAAKDDYFLIEKLPEYKEMLQGKYTEVDLGTYPPRIPFENLESSLKKDFELYYEDIYISRLTPLEMAVPIYNFFEGLLDYRVKMPVGNYGLFTLIEDYGVRMTSYGNAAGGVFYGPYRSFLVDINGSTEIFSINVSTYCKSAHPENLKTCISVAHDDEKESHHALQLVVEDNIKTSGNRILFYHTGKIAIGHIGSGKIDELRMFVERKCPELISGKQFFLGSLEHNRLWRLDDPEVIKVIANMINYSIIRDEYREYVKNKKLRK